MVTSRTGYDALDDSLRREVAFAEQHPERSEAALELGALVFAHPILEHLPELAPQPVRRRYEELAERAHPLSERYAWHRYFWETAQGSD